MIERKWLAYSLELMIVAYGVFLGMIITEFNASKKEQKQVETTIHFLIKEMESNLESLETAVAYHKKLKIELDSVKQQVPQSSYLKTYISNRSFNHNRLESWKGVGVVGLDFMAYESAKLNGVFQNMPIEVIQLISKSYRYQEQYVEFGKSALDKMLNLNSETKVIDVISIFELLTGDILSNEEFV